MQKRRREPGAPRAQRDVALGRAAQQAVLSTRALVDKDDSARFIGASLEAIRAYMDERQIQPAGPAFAICRDAGRGALDVEVGWPLSRPVEGSGPIHGGSLPSALIRHDARRAVNAPRRRRA